jgi:holo-[acyl-carrier protein] synthase
MEIRNDAAGKPSVALGGGAREVCERLGIGDLLVSISHCRTHATALAIALATQHTEPS